MEALTSAEYKTYLSKNDGFPWGIRLEDRPGFHPYYETSEAKCTDIPFPNSAGKFSYLASSLFLQSSMDQAEWGGGTLVYDDWGVWGLPGNLAGYQMVERIRSTFGEQRPFHQAPVHIFRQDERYLLTNFILAALIYGWDAYYIPNYEGWFAHISHDEYCVIVTKRTQDFADLIQPQLTDPESGYRVLDNPRFCRLVQPDAVDPAPATP